MEQKEEQELETTPAMIEAGAAVVDHIHWRMDPLGEELSKYVCREIAEKVFKAMLAAGDCQRKPR